MRKNIALVLLALMLLAVACGSLLVTSAATRRENRYNLGRQLAAQHDWRGAITEFAELGQYNNSKQWLDYVTDMERREERGAEASARQRERAAEAVAQEAEQRRLLEMVGSDPAAYRNLTALRQAHPDWDAEDCAAVVQKQVRVGMSREQVIASRGRPDHINTTSGSFGVHEQWVYEVRGNYLYFEDGILTAWQTER